MSIGYFRTGARSHAEPAVYQRMRDDRQALEVALEREDAAWVARQHAAKQRCRRTARAVAQLLLGQAMRMAGVEYTPELEQLAVDCGDGTSARHWTFSLHGLLFSLGPHGGLAVHLPTECRAHAQYECWNIVELGEAVQALGRRQ